MKVCEENAVPGIENGRGSAKRKVVREEEEEDLEGETV